MAAVVVAVRSHIAKGTEKGKVNGKWSATTKYYIPPAICSDTAVFRTNAT